MPVRSCSTGSGSTSSTSAPARSGGPPVRLRVPVRAARARAVGGRERVTAPVARGPTPPRIARRVGRVAGAAGDRGSGSPPVRRAVRRRGPAGRPRPRAGARQRPQSPRSHRPAPATGWRSSAGAPSPSPLCRPRCRCSTASPLRNPCASSDRRARDAASRDRRCHRPGVGSARGRDLESSASTMSGEMLAAGPSPH